MAAHCRIPPDLLYVDSNPPLCNHMSSDSLRCCGARLTLFAPLQPAVGFLTQAKYTLNVSERCPAPERTLCSQLTCLRES